MKIITRRRIRKALPDCSTFQALAERIGVTRQAVSQFMNAPENEDLLIEFGQHIEKLIDLAETKLASRVERDDLESIKFTLRTQGRRRGWAETPQVLLPSGIKIAIDAIGYQASDFIDVSPLPKQITRHAKKYEEDSQSPADDSQIIDNTEEKDSVKQ